MTSCIGFVTCPHRRLYDIILSRGFQVVCFITFICSVVYPRYKGDGWVEFVSMSALLTVGINFIFYLIGLRQQLPPFMLLVVSTKPPRASLVGAQSHCVHVCVRVALGQRAGASAVCRTVRIHVHPRLLSHEPL